MAASGDLRPFHSQAATPTVTYPWGALTAGWRTNQILPASFNAPPANTDGLMVQLISWHEIDQDGDGLMACLDCDDLNPADIVCAP